MTGTAALHYAGRKMLQGAGSAGATAAQGVGRAGAAAARGAGHVGSAVARGAGHVGMLAKRYGPRLKKYLTEDISGKDSDKAEEKVPTGSHQQPAGVTA
jgi:hypothetical protein